MSLSVNPIPSGNNGIPYIPLNHKDLNGLLGKLMGKEVRVWYTPRNSNIKQELIGTLKFTFAKNDINRSTNQPFNVVSLFFCGDIARNIKQGREVVITNEEKVTRLMFVDGPPEQVDLIDCACGIIHSVGTSQAYEISKKNKPNT